MDKEALINLHKRRPTNFGNIQVKREKLTKSLQNERHQRRTNRFNLRRNISITDDSGTGTEKEDIPTNIQAKVVDRKQALLKYKEEKKAIKKLLKAKEKPPFKVGIPHHGSSPILRELTNHEIGNDVKGEKESRMEFNFQKQIVPSCKKLTSPQTPTVLKRSAKKNPPILSQRAHEKVPVKNLNQESKSSLDSNEPLAAPLPPLKQNMFPIVYVRRDEVTDSQVIAGDVTPNRSSPVNRFSRRVTANLANFSPQPGPSRNCVNENTRTSFTEESIVAENSGLVRRGEVIDSHVMAGDVSAGKSAVKTEIEELHQVTANLATFSPQPGPSRICGNKSPRASFTEEYMVASNNGSVERSDLKNFVISPNVNMKRDKNAPKEDISESTIQRNRLDDETRRLLALAELWEIETLKETIPSDIIDEIDSVVGNTRLLTRDKFSQFRGLIDKFENNDGKQVIKIDDLNGFWEMMYIQVEQLIKRYDNLTMLKQNNWVVQPEKPKPKKKKAPSTKKKPIIAEAVVHEVIPVISTPEPRLDTSRSANDSMNMATFVLSNRRRTRSNSPASFIAMRLSGVGRDLGKTPEIKMEPVAESITPILKTHKLKAESCKSEKKGVQFNDYLEDFDIKGNIEESQSRDTKSRSTELIHKIEVNELELITPRRSERLKARTPTSRYCSACSSPHCDSHDCLKESKVGRKRQSRRINHSSAEEVPTGSGTLECVMDSTGGNIKRRSQRLKYSPLLACDSITPPEVVEPGSNGETSVPSTANRKFVLRPSVLSGVNLDRAKTKTGKRRMKRNDEENTSPRMEYTSESNENIPPRSTKRSSARKVKFNSSCEEKTRLKLPVTPYRKSGGKKT